MFVSNTSTLILLAKISSLQKFIDVSPEISIPEEVEEEATCCDTFDAKLIAKAIETKKIRVKKASDKKKDEALTEFRLDRGEAAAYALFEKGVHTALLTDDAELIKLCRIERIPFLCAMAIVVRLYEKSILNKEEALAKMEKLVAIGRYSKNIYERYSAELR